MTGRTRTGLVAIRHNHHHSQSHVEKPMLGLARNSHGNWLPSCVNDLIADPASSPVHCLGGSLGPNALVDPLSVHWPLNQLRILHYLTLIIDSLYSHDHSEHRGSLVNRCVTATWRESQRVGWFGRWSSSNPEGSHHPTVDTAGFSSFSTGHLDVTWDSQCWAAAEELWLRFRSPWGNQSLHNHW